MGTSAETHINSVLLDRDGADAQSSPVQMRAHLSPLREWSLEPGRKRLRGGHRMTFFSRILRLQLERCAAFTLSDEAFRLLVVACQAATILITWRLWLVRDAPPMLPALPLPQINCGALLLGPLLLTIFAPLWGIALHSAGLIYAVLIDQTRMQPETISLAFLLWGTLPNVNFKTIALAHLTSLWLFAGLHKLLSPGFIVYGSKSFANLLVSAPPLWVCVLVGLCIASAELSTGLLALSQRARRLTGMAAFGLHMGILLVLSPMGRNANVAVWPWNGALALAGFALIVPWQGAVRLKLQTCHFLVRVLAIFIFLVPLGFYLRLTDAYLAHNLYSANTPSAKITGIAAQPRSQTWRQFHVPFPPLPRLYKRYFQLVCHPGDKITIRYPLWWRLVYGEHSHEFVCDLTGAGEF